MFIDCDRRESGRLTIIHAQNPGCDTLSRKSLTIGRGLADGYWWDTEWRDRNISQHNWLLTMTTDYGLSCQYLSIFLTTGQLARQQRQSAGYIFDKARTAQRNGWINNPRYSHSHQRESQENFHMPGYSALPPLLLLNTIFTQGSPDNTENHPHRYLLYKLTRLWYLLSVYQYILYVFLFTMLSLIKDNV